jgi:hypothetical protein
MLGHPMCAALPEGATWADAAIAQNASDTTTIESRIVDFKNTSGPAVVCQLRTSCISPPRQFIHKSSEVQKMKATMNIVSHSLRNKSAAAQTMEV